MTATTPFNLLITDDDRQARETLREVFEPVGFRTLLAESGEQAIEIVQSEPVHLALMDMHLPRLTGLETVEIVRQLRGLLPTILLSADRDDWLMRQALSARVFCVLAKPVNKNVLIYVVTRALTKYYEDAPGTESET